MARCEIKHIDVISIFEYSNIGWDKIEHHNTIACKMINSSLLGPRGLPGMPGFYIEYDKFGWDFSC